MKPSKTANRGRIADKQENSRENYRFSPRQTQTSSLPSTYRTVYENKLQAVQLCNDGSILEANRGDTNYKNILR